jgi:hypothetical protein
MTAYSIYYGNEGVSSLVSEADCHAIIEKLQYYISRSYMVLMIV